MKELNFTRFMDHVTKCGFSDSLKDFKERSFFLVEDYSLPKLKKGLSISVRPKYFDFEKFTPVNSPFATGINVDGISDDCVYFGANVFDELVRDFYDFSWNDFDKDRITLFTQSYLNNFVFIKLEAQERYDDEIIIDVDLKVGDTFSGIFVLAQEYSKSKIRINVNYENGVTFSSNLIRFILEEGAKVDLVFNNKNYLDCVSLNTKQVKLHSMAKLNMIDVTNGSNYTYLLNKGFLIGDDASIDNRILYSGRDDERLVLETDYMQKARGTKSNVVVKGILNDSSHSLTESDVLIAKSGRGSKGFESHEALLLGKKSKSNSIPKLNICNEDVECKHGSKVHRLDEDDVFYLMSRGLSREDSLKVLYDAFYSKELSVIDNLDLKTKQDLISLLL